MVKVCVRWMTPAACDRLLHTEKQNRRINGWAQVERRESNESSRVQPDRDDKEIGGSIVGHKCSVERDELWSGKPVAGSEANLSFGQDHITSLRPR